MSTWTKQKLGDVATMKYGTMPRKEKVGHGEYDLYSGYRIIDKYPESNCKKGDIIVVARGVGGTGDVKIASSDCYLTNLSIRIDFDESKVNGKYFHYKFLLKNLRYLDSGSAQSQITISNLEHVELDFPDIPTQTRIASVLSAYDDLIENNEKRIKILEEMAERLYREWFVKFKFPGHEKVRLIDSGTEYGKIPEGWEVKLLGDIALLIMGQSPTSDNYNLENKGLPFHQGVADFGYKYPIDRVSSTAGNKHAMRGDLLFSVRAPVGRMNIANKKIILGRGLSAIRHKESFQSFLLLAFADRFTKKDMIGNGAIYKSVNKDELEKLKFICPSKSILGQFESIVTTYFQEMEKLTVENQTLSKTRDLLIPQLVTGKREVKN